MKKEELKQRQLEKDLRTTRQVLNEAYREKHDVEKKSGMAIETLKFQIMSLSGESVAMLQNCHWKIPDQLKSVNETDTPIFVLLCSVFPWVTFIDFIFYFTAAGVKCVWWP